jgi:hypothetical protein
LRSRSQQELVAGAIYPTQSKSVQLHNPLEVREQHLHLLSIPT